MASAWEQFGEIERINQMLRSAQLARAVNTVYYNKHLARLSEETLLKIVAPAQKRVVVESAGPNNVKTRAMLSLKISQSAIPDRAVSAPLRRLTSRRGPISTRFRVSGAAPINIVTKLNTAIIIQPDRTKAGLVTIDEVSDNQSGIFAAQLKDVVRFQRVSRAIDAAPKLNDFKIVPEGSVRSLLDFKPGFSVEQQVFLNAAKLHQDYLVQQAFLSTMTFPAPSMDLSQTRNAVLQSVNPEKTIKARVQASLGASSDFLPDVDPLEPIMDAPEFPQPMYEALRDLSQDYLFPGLEFVPEETVMLLETNSKFVESFLVGLNAEMASELLWRKYPTDQRGTYFRQFWDTSSGDGERDIEKISQWGDAPLGKNARGGDNLVLLLRGELLRRYPNSVIYAVAAVKKDGRLTLSTEAKDEKHPLFRGTLKPDVTFLGFDLTRKKVLADPGWFFVIQQQPTEPTFGLDAADFTEPLPPLTTWDNLSWQHFAETEEKLKALSFASTRTALPDIGGVEWGKTAAHQAFITLQRPVRIAIHAKEMIKEG